MTAVDTVPAVGGDRREGRRLARRAALRGAAFGIVERDGLHALTIKAVADRVGCSVGTVYTHFDSKGALVADLQDVSVQRITRSFVAVQARSRDVLDAIDAGERERAAAGLALFGEFFVACWDALPEESHMLFSVLAERAEVIPVAELDRVVGSTLSLLALGHEIVENAAALEVIGHGAAMDRVVMGASAMLGVLLTSHLSHLDANAFDHRRLARTTWSDMLRGWGLGPDAEAFGEAHMTELAATGPIAPDPGNDL